MADPDRRFSDPEVARRAEAFRQELDTDPFPLPRIEGIALTAQSRLDTLMRGMTQEELDEVPDEGDVLTALSAQDTFVMQRIIPNVSKLLERTKALVPMSEGGICGYVYVFDNESRQIVLAIEDRVRDDFFSLDTPLDMQEGWDMGSIRARNDIRAFVGLNKGEIIDRFLDFIQEYT